MTMKLYDDLFKGSDDKYSMKAVQAGIIFVSGIVVCFAIVVSKYFGKDISLEVPILMFGTDLALLGIAGWQNISHFKIASGVVDPVPAPDVTVDNSTTVNLEKQPG